MTGTAPYGHWPSESIGQNPQSKCQPRSDSKPRCAKYPVLKGLARENAGSYCRRFPEGRKIIEFNQEPSKRRPCSTNISVFLQKNKPDLAQITQIPTIAVDD